MYRVFFSCGEWGLLCLLAVLELLSAVASVVVENGLQGKWASVVAAPKL